MYAISAHDGKAPSVDRPHAHCNLHPLSKRICSAKPRAADTFRRLMQLKYMRALAAPGEAVGVIAAQVRLADLECR